MKKDILETDEIETTEAKYAHIVSTTFSPFDATFIFYQVMPVQKMNDDNGNPVMDQKQIEVARIILPKEVAVDFSASLSGLIKKK